MSRIKQSDAAIVLMNAVNKEAEVLAESNEGRAATKGNLQSQITCRTQGRESVSQAAERIRQAVSTVCRQAPEVGAVCVNAHVRILCGGESGNALPYRDCDRAYQF